MIIQLKATEQYFPVVLFVMLYKVVVTCESVDKILICDNWHESNYWEVLPCGVVSNTVQGSSNVLICAWNHKVWYFPVVLFILVYNDCGCSFWVRGSNPPKLTGCTLRWCKILKGDDSYGSYLAVFCCGVVSNTVQGGYNLKVCGSVDKILICGNSNESY